MPDDTSPDADADESALRWGTSSFEPGRDVGLVARHTVGLIERDNPSTRARLWRLVADDAPLDDILDELSSTGLKALPDFGIAQVEGDAVRVVARGRTTITAELSSGGTREIDPSGVRTWIEEVIADVVAVTIALAGGDEADDSEGFAVLAGSIPARSVSRRYDVADDHAADAIAGWSPAASVVDGVAAEEPTDDAPAVEVEDVGDSWFDDATAAPSASIPPQPAEPAVVRPADPQPASPQPAGPPAAAAAPADPQPASPQPSGPPAAVDATAAPATDATAAPPPSGPGTGGPPPEATMAMGPNDVPGSGTANSVFDDQVVEATAAPTLGPDGRTLGFSEIEQEIEAEAEAAATPPPPLVFGVLAFSNGERIGVDRSVLIGRNPKVAGPVDGGLPHIMKFDGPGQGLSRTHAEVRVEDGDMVLEDLQSTNGTEVQLPGQQRRRLRGGEPIVVVPGTLIDFGDELHCTVETAT